jgi:hypothetical protein
MVQLSRFSFEIHEFRIPAGSPNVVINNFQSFSNCLQINVRIVPHPFKIFTYLRFMAIFPYHSNNSYAAESTRTNNPRINQVLLTWTEQLIFRTDYLITTLWPLSMCDVGTPNSGRRMEHLYQSSVQLQRPKSTNAVKNSVAVEDHLQIKHAIVNAHGRQVTVRDGQD